MPHASFALSPQTRIITLFLLGFKDLGRLHMSLLLMGFLSSFHGGLVVHTAESSVSTDGLNEVRGADSGCQMVLGQGFSWVGCRHSGFLDRQTGDDAEVVTQFGLEEGGEEVLVDGIFKCVEFVREVASPVTHWRNCHSCCRDLEKLAWAD